MNEKNNCKIEVYCVIVLVRAEVNSDDSFAYWTHESSFCGCDNAHLLGAHLELTSKIYLVRV